MATKNMTSVEFEVFGKVQKVFFRKFTQEHATKLGLRGWCENTDRGTVRGVMQGDRNQVAEMKRWLRHTGSPKSQIERAVFKEESKLDDFSFTDFSVRR